VTLAILAAIVLAAIVAIVAAVSIGEDAIPDSIATASDAAIARQLTTTLTLPEG
jgi:hypothetical protein